MRPPELFIFATPYKYCTLGDMGVPAGFTSSDRNTEMNPYRYELKQRKTYMLQRAGMPEWKITQVIQSEGRIHTRAALFRDLKQFWRKMRRFTNPKTRIGLLKHLAERVYAWPENEHHDLRRQHYRDVTKNFVPIAGPCLVCGKPAECRHHIAQLQHGGTNRRSNICLICNACHSEIHPWLRDRLPSTPEVSHSEQPPFDSTPAGATVQ